MASALLIAFVLVTLAELGDKTQLLTVALASRYSTRHVVVGVAAAILVLQAIATLAGGLVGSLLPRVAISLAAGTLFVVFGVLTWRGAGSDDGDDRGGRGGRFGPIVMVAAAFFIAELGDKTQVMTMAIAADPAAAARLAAGFGAAITPPSPGDPGVLGGVWLGSSLGMAAANGLAIGIGAMLGKRVPERLIRRVAAVVFVLFGLAMLASALIG